MYDGTDYPSVVAKGWFCADIVVGPSLTGPQTLTAAGDKSGRTPITTIQVLGVSTNAGATTSIGCHPPELP